MATFNIVAHHLSYIGEVGRSMRTIGALLSSILLLGLSIPAQAANPYGIAEPAIKGPNMDMPAPLVSKPNLDMPAPNPKPLVEPSKEPSPALNQSGNITSNETQEEKQPVLDGKWLIKLDDGRDGSLDLILFTLGGTGVNGYGTLIEQGTTDSVTARGSVAGEELSLTIKSATSNYINEKYDECDLHLLIINNTLSGTYALKSKGQSISSGNASAMMQ
jgi:hypothetical protein